MNKKIYFLVVLTFLIHLALSAGTTGKLAGRVTDSNGDPVAFANVFLQDTQIGAQTNEKGQFIIINIPPGTYNVICSLMGYGKQQVNNVKINLDETTIQNFTLQRAELQMETVKVTEAKEELVSKSKTSSGKSVTSEEIEDLNVDDIDGLVAIQAGANIVNGELHMRGGRANEVGYSIDGMRVSDPVDGGAALTIDKDAIATTKVMTGGLPAEFGNAQSGMVNIVTKSGSEDYHGKVEFRSDHLVGDEHSNSDLTKVALGGPVFTPMVSSLRDKFTFYFNGAANWHDSRYREYYVSNPVEELKYLVSDDYSSYDPYEDRDEIAGFDVGSDRNYNNYNANIKFKYQFTSLQKMTFAVRGDQETSEPYIHTWKYALNHGPKIESSQRQFIVTYENTITPKNILTMKASLYNKALEQNPKGVSMDEFFWKEEDPGVFTSTDLASIRGGEVGYLMPEENGVLGEGQILNWQYNDETGQSEGIADFAEPGSVWGTYIDDENSIFTFKADYEYQYNQIHGFKSGIELIKHYIKKDRLFNPWSVDAYRFSEYLSDIEPAEHYEDGDSIPYNINDPDSTHYIEVSNPTDVYKLDDIYDAVLAASGETDGYKAYPWQGAFYLQDKMQWEGLIVNAGLRFDFWYLGESYKIIKENGVEEEQEFDEDDRLQFMVSPRLGISHPISERSVLHFAYNYQNQLPQMQYIFTTATPEDAITSDTDVIVGKADLQPQITITYEVGLNQQLSENFVFDITTYYKNIYNYVSKKEITDPENETITWQQYVSEDYGSARGIDLNLTRQLSNFISGSASYSLAWAEGNNSDTQSSVTGENLREFPLNWDQRHNFNLNMTFKIRNDEEFFIPGTDVILPIDDFSTTFSYNISSGRPYTPITQEGNTLDTNSERQPYTETAGLKISKQFRLSKTAYIKLYADIENLFNKTNVYDVYAVTGSPYSDGADLTEPNSDFVDSHNEYIHDLADRDPSNVSNGRVYKFGLSFNW